MFRERESNGTRMRWTPIASSLLPHLPPFKVQRRNTTVILKALARLCPRKERGHLRDDHSSCGAVNMIRIKEMLVCLPMDREGYHIGGQSCYRALSSLLRASGSLHPSVKSNDCWNRMASAVELPAGTVPSI